jgi:transcription elongation factor Elf1
MSEFLVEKSRRVGSRLRALRAQHDAFIQRRRDAGLPTHKFMCPLCRSDQVTPCPENAGETWDSLTTCTACGQMLFKIVTSEKVTIRPADPEAAYMTALIDRMIAAGRPDDEIAAVRERDQLLKDLNKSYDAGMYLLEQNRSLQAQIDDLELQLNRALPAVRK